MITNLKIGYNGRFGNQLFQLAALVGVSEKNGYRFVIPKQNLRINQNRSMDGKIFDSGFILPNCFDIDSKYYETINSFTNVVTEKHFHFDENIFNISDGCFLDGYFQTEKYFSHCKEKLFEILKFRTDIIEQAKNLLPDTKNNLVSIHIRRGDYTYPNPYHPVLGVDYIENALDHFKGENYHFVVFSDDIDWCKSVWSDKSNFSFFDSKSQYIDFCAMSMCHHNIITNSSFSWWASYFNMNTSKKVIAPNKWFGTGYSHYNTNDLYRNDMTLVDVEKFYDGEVNILTICTGSYTIFFEQFYNSCEKYFLKNTKKKYFVFTDGEIIKKDNVVRIEQQKLGWPYDTMMRFKMFNSIREQLTGEYVFFFNANMKFLSDVGTEVLPGFENDYLMGVKHPGYYSKPSQILPYERRSNSNLFIPYDRNGIYYQGCFNGGRTEEFMKMSKILEDKINNDLSNGIIPIWHDESALNHYFIDKKPLAVDPSYAYPESVDMPFEKKIIQLDKNKYGGHQKLRN